ncbi:MULTISPECIES: carboxymuconolactone decarboxylase family protein [Amycolatopsis]|uniref:Alkylhydroperoxidase AhpD family core domain-containing protein n=2 Tax=Amycolatopsis TaxID=1813 RepID=A0A1I3MJD9_9PSEU|nr:carboxymuconolactone decarboxylase family protein [Amycolatopsis sacchari]SFI96796.1 alkylhydroperoxidase AhpD family core domain-containing protein [Amycolatopsis sacchari]
MTKRIQISERSPQLFKHLLNLHHDIEKAAADAGLDQRLIELVKIRASLLNGCAYCLDLHARDARKLGETERRVLMVGAWQETDFYSEQERAALALTDAMTRLSQVQDVPDDVYEQATTAFTEEQYLVVAWAITAINAFNRLGVTSHKPLPENPR